ncbi:ester cyclase [Candidatus Woesearchaeota archaeon]|nr:ester cyclase [Candidatus Woesearchaeota archaeon]
MEKNKELMHRFYEEVFNKGNLSAIDEIFDENFVDRSFYGKEAGIDEIRNSFKELRKTFPDARIKIEDMIAENDKVATRFVFSGTQKGEFMGISPTGKKISMSVMDIIRIKNNKIIERWGIEDNLSLWKQLGIEPPKQ